jgi:hypothetical protein
LRKRTQQYQASGHAGRAGNPLGGGKGFKGTVERDHRKRCLNPGGGMARVSSVNKKVIFLSLILFIPFLLWFGHIRYTETRPEGGTLYVALPIPFYDLDVLSSSGLLLPEMTIMNNLILERLFALSPTGDIIPELGLSATPDEDGLNWDSGPGCFSSNS